jgi:nucleotide-binding universal stress UspA family protein
MGGSVYKHERDEALLARATREVEQLLEKFSLRCVEAGVSSKVLEDVGVPYEQVVKEAERYDLIVLGKQTHFHFATQRNPCETLERLLKTMPRPVVAVPEQLTGGSAIVVAFDGSLQANRALQAFESSGLAKDQQVHVVTVGADHLKAARQADHAAEFLRFHDIAVTPHHLPVGESEATTILDKARELQAGLIVMGCYGRSAFREFFFGSVTCDAVNRSPLPLFLYH